MVEVRRRIERYRRRGARIGENVRLFGAIDAVNPGLVSIGDHCVIGQASALLCHGPVKGARGVTIEDEVWIGYGAIVLPGVTVGRRSIVGAGAVVTRDVPPRSVVAGNPARVLRTLSEAEAERLAAMLRSGRPIGQAPPVDGPSAAEVPPP